MLVGGITNIIKNGRGIAQSQNPYTSDMFSEDQRSVFEMMRENNLLDDDNIAKIKDLNKAQIDVLKLMGEKNVGM